MAKPCFTAASAGKHSKHRERKKGNEMGGIGNLKGSLGGSRYNRPGWEECVDAAELLLDMDSADFGHPEGC